MEIAGLDWPLFLGDYFIQGMTRSEGYELSVSNKIRGSPMQARLLGRRSRKSREKAMVW